MANEVTDRITVGVPWSEEAGSGGGIQEVNGQTGPSVVLGASDVGAVPDNQFASTAQRGIVQLATNAQALTGANSQNAITSSALRAALIDRHERSATTVTALGAGRYPGETALLTIADMRILIFWSGLAWRTASMRLSGTLAQRNAVQGQGVLADGFSWRNSDSGLEEVYSTGGWVKLMPRVESGRTLVSIASANTPSIQRVNFPGGAFPSPPRMSLTIYSAVAGSTVSGGGLADIDESGFSAVVTRSNTTATWVEWLAFEV